MRKAIAFFGVVCVIFALINVGAASTAEVLHNFSGPDGAHPKADLVEDAEGNLYGTTSAGGADNLGTVFVLCAPEVSAPPFCAGFSNYTEMVLYSFTGASGDGASPEAGLVLDKTVGPYGTLYGTTSAGGTGKCGNSGCGTVFSLQIGETKPQILHSFGTANDDGTLPLSELLFYPKTKSLYGTTSAGGLGNGTVFVLKLNGSGYTVLYRFAGANDGANPVAALAFDSATPPNLWGTAQNGGARDLGTIFELTVSSGYTQLILAHSFQGITGDDGANPAAALVFNKNTAINPLGTFYGTTEFGGDVSCDDSSSGCGTVFQVAQQPSGSISYSSFYSFTGLGTTNTGSAPIARLALETKHKEYKGYLYGTASTGGLESCNPSGCGTAFEICPPIVCSVATEYTLFYFNGTEDGQNPAAGMLLDFPPLGEWAEKRMPPPTGKGACTTNCIGSAVAGGSNGDGVIYALTGGGSPEAEAPDF